MFFLFSSAVLQATYLLCVSDPCQPSATIPQDTSLADDIISQRGKLMDPSPFWCPWFWWSGEQVAEGGGEWRTTAKNTHSALSTSERCTQGPHAAQTEIKSREGSGSGACVWVCVCYRMCVYSHHHQIYQVISLHHHLLYSEISSHDSLHWAGMWSHTHPRPVIPSNPYWTFSLWTSPR